MTKIKHLIAVCLAVMALGALPGQAWALCSSPAGAEGDLDYFGTPDFEYRFCDDTNWISMSGGISAGKWTAGTGDIIHYVSGTPLVGIGTATPTRALEIAGDGDTSFIRLNDTQGGSTDDVGIYNNGLQFKIRNETISADLFTIWLSGTEQGYVGINGITIPATALDMDGALTMRGLGSAPALSPVDQGRIYFSSTSDKFLVSENGGAYTDLLGGGGASAINDLSDAATNYASNSVFLGQNAGASATGVNNTFLGSDAGADALNTGDDNTFMGVFAGKSNEIGYQNTFIGSTAGEFNTDGFGNNFMGWDTGNTNTTGNKNTFIGSDAGFANVGGNDNTFIGNLAGNASTASNNTFIGSATGNLATSGDSNILIGQGVQKSVITAANELNIGNLIYGDLSAKEIFLPAPLAAVADGDLAVNQVTIYLAEGTDDIIIKAKESGGTILTKTLGGGGGGAINDLSDSFTNYTSQNVFLGQTAGADGAGTGVENTAVGNNAGRVLSTGNANTFIGTDSGWAITTGGNNVFVGGSTGSVSSNGNDNTIMGLQAGQFLDDGADGNTFMGTRAGQSNTGARLSGDNNTAIGRFAGQNLSTGSDNVFMGYNAGLSLTTQSNSTMVGSLAGQEVTGIENTFIGSEAGGFQHATNLSSWNTYVGHQAGRGVTAVSEGTANVSIGHRSMNLVEAGTGNTVVGVDAGFNIADGSQNVLMGQQAGQVLTGSYNAMIGYQAGLLVTTGVNNTILGTQAGGTMTTGDDNILVGVGVNASAAGASNELNIGNVIKGDLTQAGILYISNNGGFVVSKGTTAQAPAQSAALNGALRYDTDTDKLRVIQAGTWTDVIGGGGASAINDLSDAITDYATDENMFLGSGAGAIIAVGGQYNVTLGENTGNLLTTGDDNTFIGFESGKASTGNSNTFMGSWAGLESTGGSSNTFLGTQAGNHATTVDESVFIGRDAGAGSAGLTTGNQNVAIGAYALDAHTTGSQNIAIGYDAGTALTTGANNIFLGHLAGDSVIGGGDNVLIGYNAGSALTGGSYNTMIGTSAGLVNTADYSTFIGNDAGVANTSGTSNTFVGVSAGSTNISGTDNAYFGSNAGSTATGDNNTAIGARAGKTLTTGLANTFVGDGAGQKGGDTDNSVYLGASAGSDATGDQNIAIGAFAYDIASATGDDNIIIGYNIDTPAAGTSNYLNIGNTIYGDTSDDRIGIGAAPAAGVELDVQGDIEYTGTITDVSDIRLKKDIKPLTDRGSMLAKIDSIDTYSFRMIDDPDNKLEFGVIAQELEKILPELVRTAEDEMGTKSVNYVGLIAPLIEASKELKAENDTLKARLENMETDRADIHDAVADLTKQVNLLNKAAGNNVDKASTQPWMLIALLAMFGFSGMMFFVGGLVRRNRS